jgi:hypothetical protein
VHDWRQPRLKSKKFVILRITTLKRYGASSVEIAALLVGLAPLGSQDLRDNHNQESEEEETSN